MGNVCPVEGVTPEDRVGETCGETDSGSAVVYAFSYGSPSI